MGHPARRQRRVRRRHGGGGRVSPPARSGVSIGLPGRDLQTKETRVPIPARPGRPRTDYEYERNGTANIFLLFVPLEGWRHVEVTDRHAGCITPTSSGTCQIAGIRTPRRSPSFRIISARTNPPRSMKAFPPAEARRLVERFEWHYTPKHGSWLNMAETELSVLSSQCLDRRIATERG